jgi:hypothetical protein
MAACGLLLSLGRWGLSPAAMAALVFLALSVAGHVAGNAIGTRLRQMGDEPQEPLAAVHIGRRIPQAHEFAPATSLSQRYSLGWSIIVASSIGVASGAVGGGLWTFAAGRGHAGSFDIAIGVVAFATLGGLAAFATVSFAQVLCGAFWQALNASAISDSSEAAGDAKS